MTSWVAAYVVPLWLHVLPLYAELLRGEGPHARDHVEDGVPDLRVATLPHAS